MIKIDRGFVTFSTTLLLQLITVTFFGLLDKFCGQRNLKIFYKKNRKEPILSSPTSGDTKDSFM